MIKVKYSDRECFFIMFELTKNKSLSIKIPVSDDNMENMINTFNKNNKKLQRTDSGVSFNGKCEIKFNSNSEELEFVFM